jgi:hypothetical protein
MGYEKRWDVANITQQLRAMMAEIDNPRTDGFTASCCKEELYMLKCFIEDRYSSLPQFIGEEKWDQKRIIQKLKQ